MTRQDFFTYVADFYGIVPDYPFEEDFVTAVFRHGGNRKWFACLTLQPHELQHTRLLCPTLSPRICLNSCPLSQ